MSSKPSPGLPVSHLTDEGGYPVQSAALVRPLLQVAVGEVEDSGALKRVSVCQKKNKKRSLKLVFEANNLNFPTSSCFYILHLHILLHVFIPVRFPSRSAAPPSNRRRGPGSREERKNIIIQVQVLHVLSLVEANLVGRRVVNGLPFDDVVHVVEFEAVSAGACHNCRALEELMENKQIATLSF